MVGRNDFIHVLEINEGVIFLVEKLTELEILTF